MSGSFAERLDALAELVGDGDLIGQVSVNQVYAAVQHNSLDYVHPRGGQALYLSQPLLDHKDRYLEDIARTLLQDGPVPAMVRSMEDLAEEGGVATHAPVLYSDLRDSGHPSVTSNGEQVYDREPRQHRLSDEELKAKYRLHHPHVSTLTAKQRAYLYASGIIPRGSE